MADTAPEPILVNRSALWSMVATFARDMLKVAGAGLVTRGFANADAVDQAAGIIVALAPIIYSQLKTMWNHRKIVTLANKVSDNVAVVVGGTPPLPSDAAELAMHHKEAK